MVFFLLFNTVIVLVVVGSIYLIWRGLLRPAMTFLVDKGILQPIVERPTATYDQSDSRRWWHFFAIGFLSVVLDLAAGPITRMHTPGWWLMNYLCVNGQCKDYDLRIIILFPMAIDASMIFFVLWGAYSVWMDVRDQDHENLNM